MGRISSGISQIGGKFRLLNTILEYIPYHEFYLEPFLGSAIVLLNKPRCRYECGNDLNSGLINYLLMTREHPKEFDKLKQGVFGLVSQEICNRIVRGEMVPKNNIERAYFFYYLNKLTFGGGVWEVRKNPPMKGNMGLVNPRVLPTIRDGEIENIKSTYRGVVPKSSYKGIAIHGATGWSSNVTEEAEKTKKRSPYRKNAPYTGINNTRALGNSANKRDMDKWKKEFKAQNKGINPKTTRPYTNNDCGLLSPLNKKAIKRLRYVNLTCYPFDKVYKMFYDAFYKRKGLEKECFCYFDRPYPGTEKYYKSGFGKEEHEKLNKFVLETPFHILESLGGECEWIIDEYKEAGLNIVPVEVRYSTDANSQKKSEEYLIMNYNINELPIMIESSEQKTIEKFIV